MASTGSALSFFHHDRTPFHLLALYRVLQYFIQRKIGEMVGDDPARAPANQKFEPREQHALAGDRRG